MKKIVLLTLVLSVKCLTGSIVYGQSPSELSLIPQPLHLKTTSGKFLITPNTRIVVDKGSRDLKAIGDQLSEKIQHAGGVKVPVITSGAGTVKNAIVLTLKNAPDTLGAEGYTLSVTPGGIMVKATEASGVFYASQTLNQLLPVVKINGAVSIPALEIPDKQPEQPEYAPASPLQEPQLHSVPLHTQQPL